MTAMHAPRRFSLVAFATILATAVLSPTTGSAGDFFASRQGYGSERAKGLIFYQDRTRKSGGASFDDARHRLLKQHHRHGFAKRHFDDRLHRLERLQCGQRLQILRKHQDSRLYGDRYRNHFPRSHVARPCYPVTKVGRDYFGRPARIRGILCHDAFGRGYIVDGSRSVIQYLH